MEWFVKINDQLMYIPTLLHLHIAYVFDESWTVCGDHESYKLVVGNETVWQFLADEPKDCIKQSNQKQIKSGSTKV